MTGNAHASGGGAIRIIGNAGGIEQDECNDGLKHAVGQQDLLPYLVDCQVVQVVPGLQPLPAR